MIIVSSQTKILEYTSIRDGEIKLGEKISRLIENIDLLNNLSSILKEETAKYIVLGVSEDIGVRANYGKKGTRGAYNCFLKFFVNNQINHLVDVSNCFILGEVFINDLLEQSDKYEDISKLRELTNKVDDRLFEVIKIIVENNKIPIVIGGGHNNSYGCIKGSSIAMRTPIDVLNIDPHADFRIEEGRHSGNGFRYAFSQSFLNRYGVWGLQENYNNQYILDHFLQNNNLFYTSFSDISINSDKQLFDFLDQFENKIGFEIDIDSIKDMPSSAISCIGFQEEYILNVVTKVKSSKNIIYYHIAEGIPELGLEYKLGKFLSYLVYTILKN